MGNPKYKDGFRFTTHPDALDLPLKWKTSKKIFVNSMSDLFHENMPEIWLNVWGNVCALISGEGVVHGEYGDLINANEERWHRATSCPDTGRSIRMAITPRSKEGQVHYFQIDQPPGN